jgi:hypothetical protein
MIRSTLLALTLVSTAAGAQDTLSPGTGPNPTTCAQFSAMTPAARLDMLSTMQPFGDDMDPNDLAASEQWTATVAAACADHPDRSLVDAARDAMSD